MLTKHHQGEKIPKAPVYVGLYIVPGSNQAIWQELIPADSLES